MLLQRYEATLAPLKKRQDQARLLVRELEDLERSYERKKRELEDTAGAKRGWAIGLAFVPFVNLVATPALACAAESDIREAARCTARLCRWRHKSSRVLLRNGTGISKIRR